MRIQDNDETLFPYSWAASFLQTLGVPVSIFLGYLSILILSYGAYRLPEIRLAVAMM